MERAKSPGEPEADPARGPDTRPTAPPTQSSRGAKSDEPVSLTPPTESLRARGSTRGPDAPNEEDARSTRPSRPVASAATPEHAESAELDRAPSNEPTIPVEVGATDIRTTQRSDTHVDTPRFVRDDGRVRALEERLDALEARLRLAEKTSESRRTLGLALLVGVAILASISLFR